MQASGLGQANEAGLKQFNWKQACGLDRHIRRVKNTLKESKILAWDRNVRQVKNGLIEIKILA